MPHPSPHPNPPNPALSLAPHHILTLLAPPIAPNTAIPHNHCKRTIIPRSAPRPCLPSKKGRWHGCRGFSAYCTVFRWSCFYDSETIPSRDGGDCSPSAPSMRFFALSHENHQHPYLARSSRCTEPFHPHNLLKTTSTASPRTISLPPLLKVRCCRPKKNCATTGGIALHPPTSPSPQPLQNHNRPSPRTTSLPCLPPLHRILLPSHLSFLFNILITANFNFAVYHIDGILSPPLP